MYAIEDVQKTRLLLDAGADANARSGEGRTVLLIAVGRSGSNAVVKLLLGQGASPSARLADGRGALALALTARDASLLQLLLDHGAGKTASPRQCARSWLHCLFRPAAQAGRFWRSEWRAQCRHPHGRPRDHKTSPRSRRTTSPNTLRSVALARKPIPLDDSLLIERRGHQRQDLDRTLFDFAKRQGHQTLVDALGRAGVRDESPGPTPRPIAVGSGAAR